jgi:DNA-binding SARP family transcriptional activator
MRSPFCARRRSASAQPPFLLITQTTLQFNRASDVAIDLADFSALLTKGASFTPDACRAALALRRGPFLADFSLADSPQFEEWLVVMTEQVDYLSGQALAHLVSECIQAGDLTQSIVWTRQQLILQPWNEEAHQQLIWQLAMDGQFAAALHHYGICRRLLAKELGVEPQPATQALVERIRSGWRESRLLAGDESAAAFDQAATRLIKRNYRPFTVREPDGAGEILSSVGSETIEVDGR